MEHSQITLSYLYPPVNLYLFYVHTLHHQAITKAHSTWSKTVNAPGLAATQGQPRHDDAVDHVFQDGVIMSKAVETAQALHHLGLGGCGEGLMNRKITLAQYPSVH